MQFARNFPGSIWFSFIIFHINATSLSCCYCLLVQLLLFAVCSQQFAVCCLLPAICCLFLFGFYLIRLIVAALFADKLLARSARVHTICATLQKVALPTPTTGNKVQSFFSSCRRAFVYLLTVCHWKIHFAISDCWIFLLPFLLAALNCCLLAIRAFFLVYTLVLCCFTRQKRQQTSIDCSLEICCMLYSCSTLNSWFYGSGKIVVYRFVCGYICHNN